MKGWYENLETIHTNPLRETVPKRERFCNEIYSKRGRSFY